MRKNLYVIGARGFGRDFVCWCRNTPGFLDQYKLCGFLDDKIDALEDYLDYPPIVSSVESFQPKDGDVFFCAMGNIAPKVKYTEMLLAKGGKFETFISPSANISGTAKIGEGSFIWNNVVVGADAVIGNHVICQSNSLVGHDCKIGDYCILDTFAACCGFVTVGEKTILHTRATVVPKITIGANAMVGVGSVVIRDVPEGHSVFGNPARRIISPGG